MRLRAGTGGAAANEVIGECCRAFGLTSLLALLCLRSGSSGSVSDEDIGTASDVRPATGPGDGVRHSPVCAVTGETLLEFMTIGRTGRARRRRGRCRAAAAGPPAVGRGSHSLSAKQRCASRGGAAVADVFLCSQQARPPKADSGRAAHRSPPDNARGASLRCLAPVGLGAFSPDE